MLQCILCAHDPVKQGEPDNLVSRLKSLRYSAPYRGISPLTCGLGQDKQIFIAIGATVEYPEGGTRDMISGI